MLLCCANAWHAPQRQGSLSSCTVAIFLGPHQPLIIQDRLGTGLLQLALLGLADAVFFQLLCALPLALCQRLYFYFRLLCTVCQFYQATGFMEYWTNCFSGSGIDYGVLHQSLLDISELGFVHAAYVFAELSHQYRMR